MVVKQLLLVFSGVFLVSSCKVFPHKWKKKVDGYVEETYREDTLYIRAYFMCSARENAIWQEGEPVVVRSALPYNAEDVFEYIRIELSGKVNLQIDSLEVNRCSYDMSRNMTFEMSRNIQREVVYYFPETDGLTRMVPYILFTLSNDENDPSAEGNQILKIQVAMFLVKDEKIIYLTTSQTDESWQLDKTNINELHSVVESLLSSTLKELMERVQPKN
ncbi:MAG: hypothetical protein JJU02_12445 [Cryomorphaceae bacterium]|nr:hypothetical protein [Cryomorphaceae bacterium]